MRAWYPVGRPDADLEDLAAGLYTKGVLVLQPKAGQKGAPRGTAVSIQLPPHRRGSSQGKVSVLVRQDELAIGVKKTSFGKAAVLPDDPAGLHLHSRKEGGTEVAARTVDLVPHSHRVADMDAHPVGEPQLLDVSLTALATELQHPAAAAVGGGAE
jgi:hypothetical protein